MSGKPRPALFGQIVAGCALLVGVFHLLIVGGFLVLSTMEIRIIHLALMMVILFIGHDARYPWVTGLIPALIATAIGVYFLSRWQAIALSGGDTNSMDLYAGVALLVLVLEAARRSIGLVLAAITTAFLVYPFISPILPGVLEGRGVSANRVVNFLTTTTEGVYGIPLGVAATYIIMFSLYGAFLNTFGAGDFFFGLLEGILLSSLGSKNYF